MSTTTPQLEILYDSGPCLVVNKPPGLLTQAPAGIDSLEVRVKAFYRHREQKEGNIYLGLPHRLDRPVSVVLVGGGRLLVTGPNGAGKSTLLGILSARLPPASGLVHHLSGATVGLLAQEDGDRRDGHRSPGEARRQVLTELLSRRPDVLLLDEPTNHLSASFVDALTTALRHTPAAVVVATHDRQLLTDLSGWPRLDLG